MILSSVKILDISRSNLRCDASFHLSEGEKVKRVISLSPYRLLKISDVSSDIFYGNRAKRIYVSNKEKGISFLSSSDILQSDLENTKMVSKKYTQNIEQMSLKRGWTLITRSGTIGNCVFANANYINKIASEHVIRLVPNNVIKQGLLYAYLASKYGHSLLTQGTFGAVIQHIEPEFIASLPIPIFPVVFQKEVDDLIQESALLREEASAAIKSAIDLFESEIGTSKVNLGFNTKVIRRESISTNFCRFDSQFQIGKVQISKYPSTVKIGDVATRIFVGNRGKRYYVDKGIPFLSSSDMMLANPLKFCKYISKNTPSFSEMLVNYKDILISRSGTVGNTIIVGKSLSGVAVSEHAMRLVIDSKKISPEYVYAYFMTRHGHDALQVLPYGSVIVTLGEEFLADVDLPIINNNKMNSIIQHVSRYIEKLDESVELENMAISMVEQEIEKWSN